MMTNDEYKAVVKLNDVIAEQRIKIEQQAKELKQLKSDVFLTQEAYEMTLQREKKQEAQNKTLREALQACQNRLGCGCGDILCTTCSTTYDLAEQTLKEVS